MRRQRNWYEMKEQDKATIRDVNGTIISKMHDREFKAMIIRRVTTGLEKRVEDMSETLNTEIRNKMAEIKGSINKIRNMIAGMNSRMEEVWE